MCLTLTCGITTTVLGAILVFTSAFVGYYVIPDIVEAQVINELALNNDTEAMERFEEVPFALNFTVRLFNVSNSDMVTQGAIPVLTEVGPYVYSLYQKRVIEEFGDDYLVYRQLDHFYFNEEYSYPNSEDDVLTIVNAPFHAVLNVVEQISPALLGAVNLGLTGIFGQNNTGPLANVRVRDLLFDGIPLCENSVLVSGVACSIIRSLSADLKNLAVQPDNSVLFSLLSYRNGTLGERYNVSRGLQNIEDLGRISKFSEEYYFRYWPNKENGEVSTCNMIRGTDSGIFNPFIDINKPLWAINPDICRSVEVRYEKEVEFKGISGVRFSADEWMFSDEDGCYCLNITNGITREDGCMLSGVSEMYTCIGAHLILSYPHFLYADPVYASGVLGLTPNRDLHKIFLDIEPTTGVVMRGAKRAQFNIFMRPMQGVPSTQRLQTTLTPIFWIDEGLLLPDEYAELISSNLSLLSLVQILVPVVVAVCSVVFVAGVVVFATNRLRKDKGIPATQPPTTELPSTLTDGARFEK